MSSASALRVKSLQNKQKLSRKDAKAQRYRKEKPSAGQSVYDLVFGRLCVFFASLRLCVRFFGGLRAHGRQAGFRPPCGFIRVMLKMAMIVLWGMMAFINPGDAAMAQEQKVSAHGFNKVRIEQEDRLAAPPEKADELWNFMHERFVKDTVALRQLDPLFTS